MIALLLGLESKPLFPTNYLALMDLSSEDEEMEQLIDV